MSPDVLARTEGLLGHVTLNRPERINALTLEMIGTVRTVLAEWAGRPTVEVVLIDGAGDRGLCAGGDLRAVYGGIHRGADLPGTFWGDEYRMNEAIAGYPKPVVAFMDGVTMGGGVGISAHGAVRIVTETTQVAMPETAIGLSPDVGGLYLLARAPGLLGTHAALTGARFGAADAISAGLADHFRPRSTLAALAAELRDGRSALAGLTGGVPPPGRWPADREWINACYGADTAEEILAALAGRPELAARSAAATLAAMSPTAVKVTLQAIRNAASMTLPEVLDQDLRVSAHFMHHPDFAEGIRALLIDKDRRPQWLPPTLAEVDDSAVPDFFAPLPPA